jgi:AraC-like DNA-binding protein
VPTIPDIEIDLGERPRIVQTGLSLHGVRAVEKACLLGLWSLHAYHYQGEIRVQGQTFAFRPGWVSLIPPDTMAEWHFPSHAPHHYVHFAVEASGLSSIRLPQLQNLGQEFDGFCAALEQMIQYQARNPLRASVRLWDLLQRLQGEPVVHPASTPLHTSVQKALAIVRDQQAEGRQISVHAIAGIIGVSHNHLTRIFKKFYGCGVKQFLLRERLARACHLLADSSLDIKSIAIETGTPDLHYFNKLIHQATGLSPSAYRRSAKGKRKPPKIPGSPKAIINLDKPVPPAREPKARRPARRRRAPG